MNILHKLLLLLSLSMTPAVTVSAAENTDFDTFQTADQYLADFDYLTDNTYRVSYAEFDSPYFDASYTDERFSFYIFPIYYDLDFESFNFDEYYSNEFYKFFTFSFGYEDDISFLIHNYIGYEVELPFLAIDTIGMSQVIEHDKAEKSNSISIYNSFYNFFTGFFPTEIVNEYHGIFTFIVVGFLLFLVFGFVFFLFRVIRRLVGFK